MSTKSYKARTLNGAQVYVRMLLKQREETNALLEQWQLERRLLAMLAADGPCFFNPLEAMEAKRLRDEILRKECRRNPDGTPLK